MDLCVGFSKVKKRFGDVPALLFILPAEPQLYVGQRRGSSSINNARHRFLSSTGCGERRIRSESSWKRVASAGWAGLFSRRQVGGGKRSRTEVETPHGSKATQSCRLYCKLVLVEFSLGASKLRRTQKSLSIYDRERPLEKHPAGRVANLVKGQRRKPNHLCRGGRLYSNRRDRVFQRFPTF